VTEIRDPNNWESLQHHSSLAMIYTRYLAY